MSYNSKRKIAFNYFGGKYTYCDEIYEHLPEASRFTHFVELCGGSGVLSLNYEGRVIRTINEINSDITNFFQVLRDHESDLLRLLELTPCSLLEYNNCWEPSDNKIEQARRFYVRARQSFFGLGAQRKNKGWHMAKTHVNAQGGETVSKWNNAIPKLHEVAKIIRSNFQILNLDCEAAVDKIDFPQAFFYFDPPYTLESRKSSNDYKYEFSKSDHERMADRLHKIDGLAMVSGYDCELMNKLYGDFRKVKLRQRKNNIRSGLVQETIWMNY